MTHAEHRKSGAQPGNKNNLVHGHARRGGGCTPTYYARVDMRRRCNNPRHPAFKWYGARGIAVCERWESFENFLSDMGEKPKNTSLDRKDNDGGYSPGNCRWGTLQQQNSNRRSVRLITCGGRTLTVRAWSRETGLPPSTILWRLDHGWRAESILTKEPQ